jgi:hypothetical protein
MEVTTTNPSGGLWVIGTIYAEHQKLLMPACVSAYYAAIGLSVHPLKSQSKSCIKNQNLSGVNTGKLLRLAAQGSTISTEIRRNNYM